MKIVLNVVLVIVGLFVLLIAAQYIASESGEVVVVTSNDGGGQSAETRLWVVDYQGAAWLRSGSPAAGWFQRMQADPKVTVQRGDIGFTAVATPDVQQRDAVNDLMRTKYGWADQFISLLFGRDDAIPIRLVVAS